MNEMEQALQMEQNTRANLTFHSVFFEKTDFKNPRRLVLCFMLQLFQQFTGVNLIAFYSEALFDFSLVKLTLGI